MVGLQFSLMRRAQIGRVNRESPAAAEILVGARIARILA
jgi:hypothetical protein